MALCTAATPGKENDEGQLDADDSALLARFRAAGGEADFEWPCNKECSGKGGKADVQRRRKNRDARNGSCIAALETKRAAETEALLICGEVLYDATHAASKRMLDACENQDGSAVGKRHRGDENAEQVTDAVGAAEPVQDDAVGAAEPVQDDAVGAALPVQDDAAPAAGTADESAAAHFLDYNFEALTTLEALTTAADDTPLSSSPGADASSSAAAAPDAGTVEGAAPGPDPKNDGKASAEAPVKTTKTCRGLTALKHVGGLEDILVPIWDDIDAVDAAFQANVSSACKGTSGMVMKTVGGECPLSRFKNPTDHCCMDHQTVTVAPGKLLRYCFHPSCKRFRHQGKFFEEYHLHRTCKVGPKHIMNIPRAILEARGLWKPKEPKAPKEAGVSKDAAKRAAKEAKEAAAFLALLANKSKSTNMEVDEENARSINEEATVSQILQQRRQRFRAAREADEEREDPAKAAEEDEAPAKAAKRAKTVRAVEEPTTRFMPRASESPTAGSDGDDSFGRQSRPQSRPQSRLAYRSAGGAQLMYSQATVAPPPSGTHYAFGTHNFRNVWFSVRLLGERRRKPNIRVEFLSRLDASATWRELPAPRIDYMYDFEVTAAMPSAECDVE